MRIVVDAMGSDNYPSPDVEGAVWAARDFGDTIYIVGDEARIHSELSKHDTKNLKIEVVHASQAINMADQPTLVGKAKPDSSIHKGLDLIRNGQADAFVTAGNTGAVLAIATLFILKRINGVKRPALASLVRVTNGKTIILLDIGANPDSKPEWMVQFAIMGHAYAQNALLLDTPRVALLSNGEEEGKGTQLLHDTSQLLKATDLNFIGNIEPKEMLRGGADIVVTDGFVGNITVKTLEAMGSALTTLIRTEIKRDFVSLLGGLFVRPAFRRVYKQIDPFEIGGAPLLGVNGVVIIGHGRSDAKAIKNAVRQARLAVNGKIVQAIHDGISKTSG